MVRKALSVLVVLGILLASWVGLAAAQAPDEGDGGDLMARIADELGMTREELLQMLLDGKTLQEVAEEQGVDPRSLMPRGAGPSPDHVLDATRRLLVEVLAEALDMTPEELREALVAGRTVPELLASEGLDPQVVAAEVKAAAIARISEAVDEGRLSQERADGVIERLEASDVIERWLAGEGAPFPGRPRGQRGIPMEAMGEALAQALGMAPEELREALAEGQTPHELVESSGLEPEAVAADIKAALVEKINAAVEEGRISEERAAQMVERLEDSEVIESWLAGEGPAPVSSRIPRRIVQAGRTFFGWLREHPAARRFLGERFPGLRPNPAPGE